MPSLKTLLTTTLFTALISSAVAAPTFAEDLPESDVIAKRDDYVYGLRIAADGETPPPEARDLGLTKRSNSNLGNLAACAVKAQPKWPHVQLTKAQSDACTGVTKAKAKRGGILGAPTEQASSDGNFKLGSVCSTSQEILKYFLFGEDFERAADKLCQVALSYVDPANNDNTKLVPKSFGMWGAELVGVMARRKIAQTIWHTPNQKLNIYTGVVNLGMESTPAAKAVAFGLCVDAVNYLGETCLVGISGTGNGLHPTFQHESQKPGTVTFNDKSGKPAIAFDFSLYDP